MSSNKNKQNKIQLEIYIQKLKNFLRFSKGYINRNNPIKSFSAVIVTELKDFLTIGKKMKMAKYRVNYQKYKLDQMQKLIAQNNEHVFLKGRTLNETR
jgi:hypothetical protein